MAWITITSDDLLRGLSGPESTAVKTAALAAGQSDPVPGIVADVVAEIRGYVAGNKANILGAGATIPDKLRAAAISRLRFEAFTRLPVGRNLLTEDRVKANEDAIRLFRDVAAGRFAIDEPTTPSDEAVPSPKPSFTRRDRHFTRETQDGL